ncbi:MAG: hypothetical protein Q9P01_17930 [Anaerolineae bacterium]|nr:hypothetical protein [Anaerolineae bacterium]MDQ7036635.1 hypothetical protein [Anaerolineae bacterium]
MRKILTWFLGTFIGGIIGLLAMLFFASEDSQIRQTLREHYQEALVAGRKASAAKREALEAELKAMREGDTTDTD